MIDNTKKGINLIPKMSKNKVHRYTLLSIIGNDIIKSGKLSLFLFACIITTSLMIITTTHHTRLLNAQFELLILEQNALDIKWRNLVLKKNELDEPTRIEQIAIKKLHLQHVDPSQENIIVLQK